MKVFKGIFIVIILLGVVFTAFRFGPQLLGPGGTMYLTLIPDNFTKPQGIYEFSTKSRGLEEFVLDRKTPAHLRNVSFLGDKMVYILNVFDLDGLEEYYSQVYIADFEGRNRKQITNSNSDKRNPVLSPDGSTIAFQSTLNGERNRDALESARVERFAIFTTDLEGNERFIAQGVQPHFSPDGKSILFLKNKGLYLFNLESRRIERVWDMNEGLTYMGMKLDLSDDRKLLAWSSANANDLLVLSIDSWSPFSAIIKSRYEVTGFWPKFSPDGKYLAFQEVSDVEEINNQHLVVFKLSDGSKRTVLELDDYYQEPLWVNDWK
ncbi:MAG: PD40 domain-containing protein [Parcubacteria group bacterium]|nr:PD40 domain-containing protein [Parcubacteria group bacterium]